ncbi:preprotein translocase subunit YajC [Streptococcus agalactiae LMG 14747]|uniref:Preprotein translocase subunit YajC n=2 Tax=Streptococcus TaxID=1301 RepID=V6YZK5_STRAG|nr:preprotein translocase subunit YajC [Streptococcus acidominimus]ESV54067.1 preprotein translocase subunit YajC [Streptococcus agalactiae LMG 14747]SNV46067.1 preprotein translocase subunit YajC [Streptococcus acidominimus]
MPTLLIMVVVMAGMMYFTTRQQKKAAQERQNQMNALTKGDEVVTIGGLYGLVDEVNQAEQKIVLDVDGVYLTFELSAIKRVVTKVGDIPGEVGLVDESAITTNISEDSAIEPS